MSEFLLDQINEVKELDSEGMLQKVMDLPFHCQDARKRVLAEPPIFPKGKMKSVVVSGLGGSAIGGEILRTMIWKSAKFPFSVNRHYELPGWVSKDTLVICSSYSGNTEETLSVFRKCIAKKRRILVVSSGGELMNQARKKEIPYCEVPGGLPPRAAFGYSFITLLTALESLKLIPNQDSHFNEMLNLLVDLSFQYGLENPSKKNKAKQVAKFLKGKLPVIYSGQDHLDSVALRWKCQFNENSKQIAISNVIPEMNHNEVLGFSAKNFLTKSMAIIFLRHPQMDHPQIKRRFDILREIVKTRTAGVMEVNAQGKSLLAQMLSVLYLGDFASVYLAFLKGVDPTPIKLIDRFKILLSR